MNSHCLKCTSACCYTADLLHIKCFPWDQGIGEQSTFLFQEPPWYHTHYCTPAFGQNCLTHSTQSEDTCLSTDNKYPVHKRKSTHNCVTLLCLPGLWCVCGTWVQLCRKPEEVAGTVSRWEALSFGCRQWLSLHLQRGT